MDTHMEMQQLLDNLTKPKGSLGEFETIALKLSAIQKRVPPVVEKRGVWTFAGDHGITDEGVSLYPQIVTQQMFSNIASGGAAINVLARHCGFDVHPIDAGMIAEVEAPGTRVLKAGNGSANFARGEALTDVQVAQCLDNGRALAEEAAEDGYQLAAIGDMGIGNTSTATALVTAGGLALEEIVDRGTGIDDAMLAHKRAVIANALDAHRPFNDPYHMMRAVGGLDLATMTGFILGMKGRGVACMIDGFPVSAAAYMAWLIDPSCTEYLFSGHLSKVKGHRVILDAIGLRPLISLDMRLGEGTGAVVGGFLVFLASKITHEMATFASAGVAESERDEESY